MENLFAIGATIQLNWTLNSIAGEAFSLSGHTYQLHISCGNENALATGVTHSGNVLSWTFRPSAAWKRGAYTLWLDVFANGTKIVTVTYPNAFHIISRTASDVQSTAVQTGNATLNIVSSLDFYRFAPVVPVVGEDGYWYVNGQKVIDENEEYVLSSHTVEYDPTTKNIIIDKGRVDSEGHSIEQVITALADLDSYYQAAEGSEAGSEAGDGSRWGSYKTAENARNTAAQNAETDRQSAAAAAEGSSAGSVAGDGSRWGEFKSAEAERETASETAIARANAAAAAAELMVNIHQGPPGDDGEDGTGIEEVEQTETSIANGGTNKVRITLTDGTYYDIQIKNGSSSAGLFPTSSALAAACPSPKVGDYAFVGDGFPADIYVCATAGTWTDSGEDYDGDEVDLTDYAKKAELTQLEHEVDENFILQKGSYKAEIITNFSGLALRGRYPDGSVWKTGTSAPTYKHSLIPVRGAVAVKVTAPSSHSTITAFLTNFDAPVSGESVPFSTGTSTIEIPQAQSLFLPVPSDADALYVYFGRNADSYPSTPASVTIYYSECEENGQELTIRKRFSPHTYVAGGFRAQATIDANSSYSVWFCEVKKGDIVSAKVTNPGQYLSHGFTDVAPGPDLAVSQYAQDRGSNRVYNYPAPFDGYFIIGAVSATNVTFSIRRDSVGFSSAYILEIKKIPKRGCNLITEDCITEGVYVSGTTGNYIASANYCSVEVQFPADDARIYLNRIYAGYFALFDKDGNIVMSKGADAADRVMYSGFRLPKGVVRGRFTSQNTKATILATGFISYYHNLTQDECDNRVSYDDSFSNESPEEIPTEYNGRDMSSFRHIVCCGDSLTQGVFNQTSGSGPLDTSGYDYPANLAAISGRVVVNLGYGGATSASWLARFGDDERLSGNDCAIIQLGVNDDGSTLDTTSRTAFIGIIDRLKELNNGIKIFLAGIINGQSYRCATSDETYYTKDQWIKALYEELYATDPQVFLIDHARYGHLRDDKAGAYNTDRDNYNMGHLSAYGYNRLAQDYFAYIGWIMHNNDQDFRSIQFIGTNYT